MPAFICTACGSQFTPSDQPPPSCPVCVDERQFVPLSGQAWTTQDLLSKRHFNCYRQHEPGLLGIGSVPTIAIGQRALLIRTPDGNILWDCITLLDAATIGIINALGGIRRIAISHPHYYSNMVDWSRAFGNAPIHLHAADKQWIMQPDPGIELWDGDTLEIAAGVTLIRAGGHFAGGVVLHWKHGAGGNGALMAGDIVMVVPNRNHVSFMRSYPNLLPLSVPAVERIGTMLEPFAFETIYGPFFDRITVKDGKQIVQRSVKRYVEAIRGDGSAERL